jgi:TatD DNase family protein
MEIVDAHCHLEDEAFDADRDEVVARAKNAGVVAIVTCGYSEKSNERAMATSRAYPGYVFPCVGVAPQVAMHVDFGEALETVAKQSRGAVAIGEIGLDFHWAKEEQQRERQRRCFAAFLELAQSLDKPVVIHSRDAEREVLEALGQARVRAMLHCFSGSAEEAGIAAKRGWLISIPALPSNTRRGIIKRVGIEHLAVETDAPWLWRGRNEPANAAAAVRFVAVESGISEEKVAETTTGNARKFFGF